MQSNRSEQHWQEFALWADRRVSNGRRQMVPMLGNGARAWAATGSRLPERFSNWIRLLEHIALDTGVQLHDLDDEDSLSAAFEHILVGYRKTRSGREVLIDENRLIKYHVVPALQVDRFVAQDSLQRRLARFDAARWSDQIDLGIDDVFSRVADPLDVRAASLSGSRTTVTTLVSGVRAWHPHGYVREESAPAHIVLGVERYGRSVASAVKAFRAYAKWLEQDARGRGVDIRTSGYNSEHWVPLAITAPLLLLGTSLGRDDWDLWWFLQMRMRANVMYTALPPVFRLTSDEDDHRDAFARTAHATGIVLLDGGRTWEDAWERMFTVLGC